MENSTAVTSVLLSAYYGMEDQKPMYSCIFLFLYTVIIAENVQLIRVIYTEKTLHAPMYLFICNLAANGLYGGTALSPAVLSTLLSNSYEVTLPWCQIQIFTIHTYTIVEFTILAVMSYDRYVAICYPLQYHTLMSQSRVYKLITLTWLYPFVAFLIFLIFSILTLQQQFCEKTIQVDKIFCVNYSLVKAACKDTTMLNYVGLLSVALYTFPQLIITFYSYIHILKICALLSKESKQKALQTCVPHLFALVNFSVGCFFEIIQNRFNISHWPYGIKIFLSLYFLIFPPILNPVMYGVSLKTVRIRLFKSFYDMSDTKVAARRLCLNNRVYVVKHRYF